MNTTPFTEIILKTKGFIKGNIWFIKHPVDLRDKLLYKTDPYGTFKPFHRADYHTVVRDSVSLFNYEE